MRRRRWIGRWIAGVGVVHTLFGLVVFAPTWRRLAAEGLFNTVNGQPDREFPFWFLVSGLLMLLFGLLLDRLEARAQAIPGFAVWGLTALTAACLVVMPISGVWLLVPPVIGLLAGSKRGG